MRVIVQTDDGREVAALTVDDDASDYAAARQLAGRQLPMLGWLGRAMSDARIIAAGGDPERPSERAMRLSAEPEALP